MSSHQWTDRCPYCGYENMLVSIQGSIYIDITCPICGYSLWTEEKTPHAKDIELAKQTLQKLSTEEKEGLVELFHEENVPFVTLLREKPRNK